MLYTVQANDESEWERALHKVPAEAMNLAVKGNLKHLPDSISKLACLRSLKLDTCRLLLSLSSNLSLMTGLTRLRLYTCPRLGTLPNSVPQLPSLRCLHWRDQAENLPAFLHDATSLRILELNGCRGIVALPTSITQLGSLRELHLAGCHSLRELPASITGEHRLIRLSLLNLNRCTALHSLPRDLYLLENLTHLWCTGCVNLQTLPEGLGLLQQLENLDLSGCVKLQRVPEELSELSALERLDLSGCVELTSFPLPIGELRGLTFLRLEGCPRIPDKTLLSIPFRASLAKALVGPRQRRAGRFLVGQQHTLEQCMTAVSWIGVVMATASFLGFVSVPGGFQPGGVVRVGEVAATVPALNQSALSLYFVFDMVTFLVALATTVFAVSQNLPDVTDLTPQVALTAILVSCFLLLLTVVFGVITFVSGAFAVYPSGMGDWVVGAAVVGGVFVVISLLLLSQRVYALGAALGWGREFEVAPSAVKEPFKESHTETELLKEMLTVLQEIKIHIHGSPIGSSGDGPQGAQCVTAHTTGPTRGPDEDAIPMGLSHGAHLLQGESALPRLAEATTLEIVSELHYASLEGTPLLREQ